MEYPGQMNSGEGVLTASMVVSGPGEETGTGDSGVGIDTWVACVGSPPASGEFGYISCELEVSMPVHPTTELVTSSLPASAAPGQYVVSSQSPESQWASVPSAAFCRLKNWEMRGWFACWGIPHGIDLLC